MCPHSSMRPKMNAPASSAPTSGVPAGLTKRGDPVFTRTWRYTYLVVQTVCLAVIALLLTGGAYVGLSPKHLIVSGVLLGCLLVPVGMWYAQGRRRQAIGESALTHDGKLCLRCGYALEGLGSGHRCPECGLAFELGETKELWYKWLRRYPPLQSPRGRTLWTQYVGRE